jgi:Baseplate J-like protein
MNGSANSSHCPCDGFTFPLTISNPPGRNSISYRIGDYFAFREALLRSLPGEVELVNWRPGAEGDLAAQMVEWWAYLSDILTFYNERIANEDYLQTASLTRSAQGLVRLLGYRPRPGIGATGTLAALLSGRKSITLPQGFQIQSKPGPGEQLQIFELSAATGVQPPDAISADPASSNWVGSGSSGNSSVLLQGVVSGINIGDELLVLERGWNGKHKIVTVNSVAPIKDPRGATNTQVVFTKSISKLASGSVSKYRLLKSAQSSLVWQYPATTVAVINPNTIDLAAITRGINNGDPVLLEIGTQSELLSVNSNTEVVWYANPDGGDPTQQPTGSPQPIPIPIPHTRIGFAPALPTSITNSGVEPGERALALVRYNWRDVGTLIAMPSTNLTGTQISLSVPLPASMVRLTDQEVLISDANGNGVEADASSNDGSNLSLSNPGPADPTWATDLAQLNLAAPLGVFFNLLPVTRGQTVANEIVGSGDATISVGQEFVLKKSPLTYLQNSDSASGPDYASTLQVWVDGVEWQEVPSFYNQSPNAQVFVTREDDQNITHVQFGDGVNGARLPSGVNNVVATYRIGSGAKSPDPGSLTVILKSWPGLKSIVNPVQVGGGADPDLPADMQTNAPQSVLTFGRAISADDYEVTAAQAPGVARACVYWTWDETQQRNMVTVYVGDDQNAVNSATAALAQASDPNRPVTVSLANAMSISISLRLAVDAKYVLDDVVAAATAALIDPDQGLLGTNVVQIGQSLFQSQIYQACMAVAGVVAVQDLTVTGVSGQSCSSCPNCDYRYDPGQGNFFSVGTASLNISPKVASNGS